MPRHLATVKIITNIQLIEGADNIEVATINNGWKVVLNKNIHTIGEKVIYFEIDSLLPPVEWNEFLSKGNSLKTTVFEGKNYTGYRLKTIKLRGQISQGLVMPLSILPKEDYELGQDVSDILGVVKYEPLIPASISGEVEGPLPSYIIKTNEERIQNISNHIFATYKDTLFSVVEKLDGTSMSVYYIDGKFGICGRNWEFKSVTDNSLTRKARELGLERIMKEILKETGSFASGIVFQGELIGEGIQSNKYKIKGQEFRIFNGYYLHVIDVPTIFTPETLDYYCEKYSLKVCPTITNSFVLPKTLDELLQYAEDKSKLTDTTREGIVLRPLSPIFDTELGKSLSFKVISNKFLLKYHE